ncbi:hypothetical protein [Hahella chejuensis]|nr:hypothetical protein [Hahella chejuensis]
MTQRKKPDPDSVDFEEVVRKMRQEVEEIFSGPAMENEPEIQFGSVDLLYKSDSELFPDDITEYRPEEKKLRLVKTSAPSKQADDDQAQE